MFDRVRIPFLPTFHAVFNRPSFPCWKNLYTKSLACQRVPHNIKVIEKNNACPNEFMLVQAVPEALGQDPPVLEPGKLSEFTSKHFHYHTNDYTKSICLQTKCYVLHGIAFISLYM